MTLPMTHIFGGGLIGLAVASTLAAPSFLPAAMADDEPVRTMLKTGDQIFPEPLLGSDFVKPDEFIYEPSVSTEVIASQTVRKIAYGVTTFVEITTTDSGTYSTDGLASPNIRYPGIHPNPEFADWQAPLLAVWTGDAWAALTAGSAESFTNVISPDGVAHEDGCVDVGDTVYC
jgi:hypothetical protein